VLSHRVAVPSDLPALEVLVDRAIEELQRPFLTPEQIAASHSIMGIDRGLVDDGTYYVVERDGELAGCGGWSRRTTLYGASRSPRSNDPLLDPDVDPARIRAMYTDPRHARCGVGMRILDLCEKAAADEGFGKLELMATMSGRHLYERFGFVAVEDVEDASSGVAIPLTRMTKQIRRPDPARRRTNDRTAPIGVAARPHRAVSTVASAVTVRAS
jgi:GNAT superfamily N-acetyltransferase